MWLIYAHHVSCGHRAQCEYMDWRVSICLQFVLSSIHAELAEVKAGNFSSHLLLVSLKTHRWI